GLRFKLRRLFGAVILFRHSVRTLKRRICGIRPESLQIRLAIGRFCRPLFYSGRRFPWCGSQGLGGSRCSDEQREYENDHQQTYFNEKSLVHTNLLKFRYFLVVRWWLSSWLA